MSKKSKNAPTQDGSDKSTPTAIASTPLRRSRWQLVTAGIAIAVWIAFLIAMAFYN